MSATTYTDDKLLAVWQKAARAKAAQVRGEANLHAAFCMFAHVNSLQADQFDMRTKAIEERLVREARGEIAKKAVRSTASSSRSVVSTALTQGRTVVRNGKPVGKNRLGDEAGAVNNGHAVEAVMEADTNALKSMKASSAGSSAVSADVQAANDASERAMDVADAIKAMLKGASDELVADIAYELAHIDPRLTEALRQQVALAEAA